MSDKKQVNKPVTIMYDDCVKQLYEVCNKSGLPPFLLELALRGVYLETRAIAQQQLEKDKKVYMELTTKKDGDE